MCLTALKRNDGAALARLAIKPGDYDSANTYYSDAQCVDLLRKFSNLPSGINTKAEAISGFKECEERCRDVNDALSDAFCNTIDPLANNRITMLDRARGIIKEILGVAPKLANLRFEFGPGATSQCRANVPKSEKYARIVQCTPELAVAWQANSSAYGPIVPLQTRYGMKPTIRAFERISTVPKNAKIDRTIGVPVHLNAFVQRGVGLAIRAKLDKYVGLSLSEVPEYHALLAGVAHLDGLSTIDLSSASDTISYILIKELLPPDWFHLLVLSRVHYYDLEGEIRPYEKFSAMGNGYTFELETLVFYAIALAATAETTRQEPNAVKHMVSVFGDDIICQRAASQRIVESLLDAGFVVNQQKTFLDGAFFESCGADFFNGHAVRSVFVKELSTPMDVIVFYNMIIEISQRASAGQFRCKKFKKSCDILVDVLKNWFDQDFSHCRVPSGYSHGLVSSFDEALPTLIPSKETWGYHKVGNKRVKVLRQGWQGWQHKYCQFVPYVHDSTGSELSVDRWLYERSHVSVDTHALRGRHWRSDFTVAEPTISSTESIRKRGRYSVGRTHHFSEWCGPGPWF